MKKILTLLLLILLTLSACNTNKAEILPPIDKEEIKIIVANDLHYIAPELYEGSSSFPLYYENGDGKHMEYIEDLTEAFLQEVIAKQPDFLIINGDLTFNGEKISHLILQEKLLEVKEHGITVLVTPGNHDINSPFARQFIDDEVYYTELITAEEFATIYRQSGYNYNFSYDPHSLSYFVKINDDYYLALLDVNLYEENMALAANPGGRLEVESKQWLTEQLDIAAADNAQVIFFTHQSLIPHNNSLTSGYVIENRFELLELLAEYGHQVNISAHIHVQHIAKTEINGKMIYDISNSALPVHAVSYGEITLSSNGFLYERKIIDMENYALINGLENPDFLDFSTYSYQYFYDMSYNKFLDNISAYVKDEEEAASMATAQAIANTYYFDGKSNEVRDEVRSGIGHSYWRIHDEIPYQNYYFEMLKEQALDNQKLQLSWE